MYERTILQRPLLPVVGACALLGACMHGGGPAQISAADMPELGETSAAAPAAYRTASLRLSINTPVVQLCADPRAKAVLDSDMPGLTTRPEYDFFKHMSLKTLKSMSGGKMTDADLRRVDAELQRISVAAAEPSDR